MVRHLVDYVAIVELISDETADLDLDEDNRRDQGAGVKGKVVQRFPKEDWDDVEFPEDGIITFCQPGGWKMHEYSRPPESFNFIFTSCEGMYTYVSCLSVYESCTDLLENPDCIDVDDELAPSFFYRSDSKRASLAASCTDLSRSLYGPKCILVLSSFPFFNTFRECLCEIYSRFIEESKVKNEDQAMETVENMIALLLATEVPITPHPEYPLQIDLEGRIVDVERVNSSYEPPYTGTHVYNLVSTIGIGHTLQLVSAMITDHKIMFISSNYSTLLSATTAAQALIYPLTIRHYTFIPVLPKVLLEFVSSPTPYCTGIHMSSFMYIEDGFLGQTVVVDMDSGTLRIPADIELEIPSHPTHFRKYLTHCLKLILAPQYLLSDLAFTPSPRKLSSPHLQDKEIRAAFMQFFAWMLAQYRCCLVVVRTHPRPVVIFNHRRFLAIRSFQDEQIVLRLFETMAFANFIEDYGPSYRVSTLFDDLVRSISDRPPRYGQNQDQRLPIEIIELANRLLENEEDIVTEPIIQQPPDNIEEVKFPRLRERRVLDLLEDYGITKSSRKSSVSDFDTGEERSIIKDRELPAEVLPFRTNKKKLELRKMRNAVLNCLTAMFGNQIFNARKVLPNAKYALACHATVRNNFVAELSRVPDSNTSLSHSQFDILAVLINTALEHDKGVDAGDFAIKIMPLTAKFCRQLQYGTVQFIYTCVQHHNVWQDIAFWERAFYCIVQQHTLDVFETMEREKTLQLNYSDNSLHNGYHEEHAPSMQQISQRALTHSALRMSIWKSLPQSKQDDIIAQEETTIIGQVVHFCSRILWLLVPLNINHEEEGNSFNNVSELDVYDQMSFNDPSSPLSKEPKRNLDKQEIVAIVERFVDNIVLKCQVEHYQQIDNIRVKIPDLLENHCEALEDVCTLAAKLPPVMKTTFLRAKLDLPPLVALERYVAEPVHVYMLSVESDTSSVQPQILPAEGALFLTNYRIIFRGYPRNSDDENTVIYRTMPLGSIYTLEGDPDRARSRLDDDDDDSFDDQFLIVEQELQIFSLTCQLFRIGFFNEPTCDGIEQFKRKLVSLRKVTKIVHTFAFVRAEQEPFDRAGGSRTHHNRNRKSTSAPPQKVVNRKLIDEIPKSPSGRLKVDGMSHSPSMNSLASNGDEHSENMSLVSGLTATSMFQGGSFRIKRTKKRQLLRYRPEFSYCEDFARLGFGGFNDINKSVSNNKPWRLTAENKDYNLCRSYPAIMVVPALSSDIELHNVARQFDRNRLPLICWKHPARPAAVLLRSASIAKRGVMDKIVGAQKTVTQKFKGSQARVETDLPDIGFRSEHTENYLNGLVHSIKQLQENCKTSAFLRNKAKNHNLHKKFIRGIRQFKDSFGMSSEKLNFVGNYSASQATLSHIPECDTVSLAQVPEEENTRITLFVIGRYYDLKNARMEKYNEVEMIGIEDMHYREVARSYELLMAALCPESDKQDFWTQIENSNWLEQIQKILEISLALVELMDKWGVSILLALEDGSNITAQISSLIQLLTDNHYRTIKGFNALIEKEWLSFGHRFSLHGRQTNEKEDNFAPIFLQFLDTVYQIHRQFPHCFEFNEFYLETLAYHHCSMRFRTFVCDSEKKRSQAMGLVRMEDDSRTSTPEVHRRNSGASSRDENTSYYDDSHSFWMYVESLKKGGPIFYNYLYRRPSETTTVLRPNIHMAALELWRYYTRDDMTSGPTYEPDLWVTKKGKDKKAMPVTPKEQVKEGLGVALITLSELRFNRSADDFPIDSPWLHTLYNYYMDSRSSYKPSHTTLAHTCRTRLRRWTMRANVHALATGKVRVDGHRFDKYTYDPFNEPEKLPCVICEGNPEITAKAQLTIKGLKCCYCQMTIHTICQLFVTRTCRKRETEEEEEPIPRTVTITRGTKSEDRKSKIGIVTRSQPQVPPPADHKNVIENHAAATNGPGTIVQSPRRDRSGREDGSIEGTLYKKGGILKQWRKWRFELNVKLKELRYYESASDAHNPLYIRKTIDLRGRVKVTPLSHSGVSGRDNHHGHGFPFMIKTERRDLVLAADTKELRDIWMKRVKAVSNS